MPDTGSDAAWRRVDGKRAILRLAIGGDARRVGAAAFGHGAGARR